ncbi:MAG: hypothetical protein J6O88_03545 [Chryseobacterium sp.]|uniref:hypothetical protein n=1 Tax=Chryseobacterium sp. TaxID=1871047 RepID=UPI001B2E3D2C|nr:hypothetical protein [Chryseobacterium sp.]MBO6183754.1 hypothetical protein [Chryseobacterium sp.]
MKKTLIYLLTCFVPFLFNAQKVKIEGHVELPDKNGWPTTFISLNDTIAKLHKLGLKGNEIKNDKDILAYTDSTNYFSINARPSDTLFFRNNVRLYHVEKYAVSDLMKKKNLVIKFRTKPCINPKECEQKIPSKLYVFVGEKINVSSVDTSDYCYMMMDSKYDATYKIEQEFGDHFPNSTITFTAYDHDFSHRFLFEDYNVNVLLFVEERCGELIHKRYKFFPVYKTKDGRWATPVDTYKDNYKDLYENIVFDESVIFDLSNQLSVEQMAEFIKNRFPEKYYRIKDGKAYPIIGIYAENMVKHWMETYRKTIK